MKDMQEAMLYKKLENRKVRCNVCQRHCLVKNNDLGFCQTRLNQNGGLFSLIYGIVSSPGFDPIEKKPFYHFHPGDQVFSVGSLGCNFRCRQCLNYFDSWKTQPELDLLAQGRKVARVYELTPEEVVQYAQKQNSPGIAYTYNEPTIWLEFVLDCARLAKQEGLYNVFVSNGSWSKETIDLLADYIDAANIDFKGFSPRTYQKQGAFFGEIPAMTKYAKDKGIRIEITTLLIPNINDNFDEIKRMADWMVKNLGENVPWHLSRFSPDRVPDLGFSKIPPTPQKTLDRAYEIGKKAGLNFIYIWAPGIDFGGGVYSLGDTVCPRCGNIAIKRHYWIPDLLGIDQEGCCKNCGQDLNVELG